MKQLTLLTALALLCGCASTTIYEGGQKVFTTQADMVNVKFRTASGTTFSADLVNHSTPTLAGGQATSQVVGSVGAIAVPLALGIGSGGTTTAVRTAAVVASAVPPTLSQIQGVVRPTNINISSQWTDPATGTRVTVRHRKHHHRHVANASPPKD